jgi:Replication protein
MPTQELPPASLGNTAKSQSTPGQSLLDDLRSSAPPSCTGADLAALDASIARCLARRERYTARVRLRDFTALRRVAVCGRVAVTDDGAVYLRGRTGDDCKAGFGGLATCGSVWACPVCSAKIAVQRVAELDKLLRWNAARGGSVALATFTASHRQGQRLKTLMDNMGGAWEYMTTGRAGEHWRKLRKLLGSDGYVRALETTYRDENGWHVHYHLLLLFDGPVSESSIANFADLLFTRWERALQSQGMTASRRHGVDVRLGQGATQSLEKLGEYMSKLTFEAAGGRFKRGRKASRTAFEILADGLETGLADDLELWLEWERASKGRRQLLYSRGLKARAGIDDLSDEQIAAAKDEGETLVILPRKTWREVYPVAVELLEATEAGGIAGAMLWLEDRELLYELCETTADVASGTVRPRGRDRPASVKRK